MNCATFSVFITLNLFVYIAFSNSLSSIAQLDVSELTQVPNDNLEASVTTEVANFGVLPKPDHALHFYGLPLGSGDGSIVQCPGGDLIIMNLGYNSQNAWSPSMVKTYLQYQLFQVTTIIVTRGMASHYNLLPYVFDRNAYFPNLKRVILGGRQQDYSEKNFTKWVNQHRQIVEYVNNQEPCISDCVFDPPACMNTNKVKFSLLGANLGSNSAGRSLILSMQTSVPNFKLVMPGDFEGSDIERLVVQEWVQAQTPVNCSHYKISSNGFSPNSNSIAFLSALKPQYAFSTNNYPSQEGGYLTCSTAQNLLLTGSIKKRKYGGNFACGFSETGEASQYLNWVYEIYTTAPYPGTYEIIHLKVPLPSN
nr:Hexaxilin-6 [Euplectella curvistellata]